MHGPKFVKHPISTPFNGDKPRNLPCFSKNEPLPRRYRMGSFFVAGCFFCDFRDICLFGDPSFPSTKVQQLFERSEFLTPTRGTSQKKNPSVCGCVCWTNLGFSVEKIVLVLVWGTYYVPHTYVPGISRQKSHHVRIVAWQYIYMNPTHGPRAWSLDDRWRLRAGGREQ